jgi:Citrate synthase, C-terminal domain
MAIMKAEMPPRTLRVGLNSDACFFISLAFVDLVGSTLADPYLAYSAALFALAGPLHG